MHRSLQDVEMDLVLLILTNECVLERAIVCQFCEY
jgi:hypothetical protein